MTYDEPEVDPAVDASTRYQAAAQRLLNMARAEGERNGRAAGPWADCTGAGDCPEVWHQHGCYADKGQCSDPLDHHEALREAGRAEVDVEGGGVR